MSPAFRLRRDLRLLWDHDHNVAALFLTADEIAGRCVDCREVGEELVLHYDAEGHCVEAEFLDPAASLPANATPEAALRVAFEILSAPTPPEEAG